MEFSEKTPLIPSNAIPRSEAIFKDEVAAHEKKWIRYRGIILLFLGLLFAQFILFNSWSELLSGGEVDDGWTWSKARPDRELKWHRCYDGVYDCAILDVPLDWLDPSDEHRASIAVIRFNATSKKDYKGPLFINPGGPGGSGIWFVKNLARYYQVIAGKNFDIISFDPRGVGHSTPKATCFLTPQSSLLWSLLSLPVLDAHPGVLHDAYAHAKAFSTQCLLTSSPSSQNISATHPNPLSYVSTASTARDMYELMTQLQLPSLQYWGFSYGTYLGLTFASLYPEKVGRMILDGNVEAEEYTSSRGVTFITDTEKIVTAFFHYCFLAGEDGCVFFSPSEEEIRKRLDRLLDRLRKTPVVVVGTENSLTPAIITYSDIKRLITSTLYRPILLFPTLAKILAALEKGDGEPYLELIPPISQDSFQCSTASPASPLPALDRFEDDDTEGSADATLAIMCSDNGGVHESVEIYGEYVDELVRIGRMVGSTMAEMRLACVGWGVEAKWRFTGPFKAPNGTATPILFIANTADNVTPLKSAQRNAVGFPGSEILVQDAYGHTTLSTPSHCTARAIKSYFQNATLPPPNTLCASDYLPFENWWDVSRTSSPEEENAHLDGDAQFDEEKQLDIAMQALMKAGFKSP